MKACNIAAFWCVQQLGILQKNWYISIKPGQFTQNFTLSNAIVTLRILEMLKKTCKNRNAGYEWPFLCQHVQEGFMGLLRAVVGRLTWPQFWNFEDKCQMGYRNMLKNQFHFFFLFLLSRSLTFKWDVQNETSIQKRKSFKNWSNTENILLS